MQVNNFLLVGIGGAIGSMARYGIGRLASSWPGGWPLATFLVNLLGSLLIGVLVALLWRNEPARLLLGVGLLGGFTTFSAFSLELWQLIERGQQGMAVIYALASVLLALLATMAGFALGRALA